MSQEERNTLNLNMLSKLERASLDMLNLFEAEKIEYESLSNPEIIVKAVVETDLTRSLSKIPPSNLFELRRQGEKSILIPEGSGISAVLPNNTSLLVFPLLECYGIATQFGKGTIGTLHIFGGDPAGVIDNFVTLHRASRRSKKKTDLTQMIVSYPSTSFGSADYFRRGSMSYSVKKIEVRSHEAHRPSGLIVTNSGGVFLSSTGYQTPYRYAPTGQWKWK